MKKQILIIFLCLVLTTPFFLNIHPVFADDTEEVDSDLTGILDEEPTSEDSTTTAESCKPSEPGCITIDASGDDSFNVGDILNVNDPTTNEAIQGQEYLLKSDTPILSFILDIVNFISRIIGVIAFGLIVIGGIRMIVSQGNEDQLQKGKALLETAVIGLVIAMFSYIIVRFVQSLFYLQP